MTPVHARNAILASVFLSGAASLIYETVLQRALKVYLAGSEAISAMIVVLVFMLGMGAGALVVARVSDRIRRPLLLLAVIELSLCVFGLAATIVLGLDFADTLYTVQRVGLSLGLPLRVIYGLSAAAALLPPCLLIGMTLPLASEVFQRQLGYSNPSFIAVLFFVSTIGAVLGATAAGFLLLPLIGQRASLLIATACNAVAGGTVFLLNRRLKSVPFQAPASVSFGSGKLSLEEAMGFALGFLSLAYEMYLFRAVAVAHRPLPENFALVLSLYLLFWSLGAFCSERKPMPLSVLLTATAALLALIPGFGAVDVLFSRHHTFLGLDPVYPAALVYTAPCLLIGWLFGTVVARTAGKWGKDVGRFYGLNTLGSCLGVLGMTIVGYEFNHAFAPLVIACGYLAIDRLVSARTPADTGWLRVNRFARVSAIVCSVFLGVVFLAYDLQPERVSELLGVTAKKVYYGSGGVIEVSDKGDMMWDGLWHSALSSHDSHVGTSNWFLATVPLAAHPEGRIDRALVIGLGTGITAGTLARSPRVAAVDTYEINNEVRRLLVDYPSGTLRVGTDPKIRILWQDGRAGLALNATRYDLITQQPLWLIQAGSSFLLSREYMQLVKSRLKDGGVFCAYSNTTGGSPVQAELVRRTAAQVFGYTSTYGHGYMVVASDRPINYSPSALVSGEPSDVLGREVEAFGLAKMNAYADKTDDSWRRSDRIVTDDRPLIEYPWLLVQLEKRRF